MTVCVVVTVLYTEIDFYYYQNSARLRFIDEFSNSFHLPFVVRISYFLLVIYCRVISLLFLVFLLTCFLHVASSIEQFQ
jgi:hypothetical protein